MKIKQVVIIGGGTAGWLAANHLGLRFSSDPSISITLVESPDIPTIGVGEGTVPAMVSTLESFGISETDFIRTCDVTFKQSIKFVNWLDASKHGSGNYYHHLFDYPFPFGDDLAGYWLQSESANGRSFAEVVSVQAALCEQGLAPKSITTPEYRGDATYAYHLDAKKFAALLAENARSKFGVNHISANVLSVDLDDSSFVRALNLDSEKSLSVDFCVDCSGFSSFVLSGVYNVPFVSKGRELLIDSALAVQVPTDGVVDIPPYTIATAHQAGWIWDIALTSRRGTGFVYSSAHMSEDRALQKYDHYLGGRIESGEIEPRKIPMNIGHRKDFWVKNCVAIGLSQGFVEPLEATAILITDHSAKMLADRFPETFDDLELLAKRYNRNLSYSWGRVIDFIKLHYFISDREDSDFWRDNKDIETVSEHLREMLCLWRKYPPSAGDFFSKYEVFDVENFLYVLYGMHFETQVPTLNERDVDRSAEQVRLLKLREKELSGALPKHRELLDKIKKFGLQKI